MTTIEVINDDMLLFILTLIPQKELFDKHIYLTNKRFLKLIQNPQFIYADLIKTNEYVYFQKQSNEWKYLEATHRGMIFYYQNKNIYENINSKIINLSTRITILLNIGKEQEYFYDVDVKTILEIDHVKTFILLCLENSKRCGNFDNKIRTHYRCYATSSFNIAEYLIKQKSSHKNIIIQVLNLLDAIKLNKLKLINDGELNFVSQSVLLWSFAGDNYEGNKKKLGNYEKSEHYHDFIKHISNMFVITINNLVTYSHFDSFSAYRYRNCLLSILDTDLINDTMTYIFNNNLLNTETTNKFVQRYTFTKCNNRKNIIYALQKNITFNDITLTKIKKSEIKLTA